MASKIFPSNLQDLAAQLLSAGPRKVVPTSRRVRVLFNHVYIVDTTSAVHVWEHDYFPQLYVPFSALQNCASSKQDEIKAKDNSTGAEILKLEVPEADGVRGRSTDRIIHFLDQSVAGQLAGLVRLQFDAMDKWLEEDVPIYVHPKDPFKRIDILQSSRPITVNINGHEIANSATSTHLLETGLPTRYYLPLGSCNQKYLKPSSLKTKCPYKGEAEYYDVIIPGTGESFENIIWYYTTPTLESAQVAGLVCFFNEKVDIWLDGKKLERPKTHFG